MQNRVYHHIAGGARSFASRHNRSYFALLGISLATQLFCMNFEVRGDIVLERQFLDGTRLMVRSSLRPYVPMTPRRGQQVATIPGTRTEDPEQVFEVTYTLARPDGTERRLWFQQKQLYRRDVGVLNPICVLDATVDGDELLTVFSEFSHGWVTYGEVVNCAPSEEPRIAVTGLPRIYIDWVQGARITGSFRTGDMRVVVAGALFGNPARDTFRWAGAPGRGNWVREPEPPRVPLVPSAQAVANQVLACSGLLVLGVTAPLTVLAARFSWSLRRCRRGSGISAVSSPGRGPTVGTADPARGLAGARRAASALCWAASLVVLLTSVSLFVLASGPQDRLGLIVGRAIFGSGLFVLGPGTQDRLVSSRSWSLHLRAGQRSVLQLEWNLPGEQYADWLPTGKVAGAILIPIASPERNSVRIELCFATWLIFGVAGAYPFCRLAWWLISQSTKRRRVRRLQMGYCQLCGYDLRASTDVCPECGAAIASEAVNVRKL